MGLGHWMMDTKTITSPAQAAELNSISPNQGTYLHSLSLSQHQYSNSALTLPYCLPIYLVICRCRSCNCVITEERQYGQSQPLRRCRRLHLWGLRAWLLLLLPVSGWPCTPLTGRFTRLGFGVLLKMGFWFWRRLCFHGDLLLLKKRMQEKVSNPKPPF